MSAGILLDGHSAVLQGVGVAIFAVAALPFFIIGLREARRSR